MLIPTTILLVASLTPAFADTPNILWISSEDNGPHLGVYGDSYADTPNLDALGARGMIYRNAWSTAPVCAPRTTIISGISPPRAPPSSAASTPHPRDRSTCARRGAFRGP